MDGFAAHSRALTLLYGIVAGLAGMTAMAVKQISVSDLRGYGRLGVDAAVGVTDIVERMHNDVLDTPGPFGVIARGLTGGVTAFVYDVVRGAMRLTGAGLDLALAQIQQADDDASSPRRDKFLAALNGVLGDYLVETKNPLAVSMRLRFEGGRPLPETPSPQRRRQPRSGCSCSCTACACAIYNGAATAMITPPPWPRALATRRFISSTIRVGIFLTTAGTLPTGLSDWSRNGRFL